MTARCNAVPIYARARADAADMRARAYAMFADMRTNPNAQYLHISADSIGRDGREERTCEEQSSEHFHLRHPVG
jgi:hypothetical protein